MSHSKPEVSYEIMTDGEEGEVYIYSLTKEDAECTLFGVRVVMKYRGTLYRAESGAIFSDHRRAHDFLVFLAKHLVTPANLPYVIEDVLDFD